MQHCYNRNNFSFLDYFDAMADRRQFITGIVAVSTIGIAGCAESEEETDDAEGDEEAESEEETDDTEGEEEAESEEETDDAEGDEEAESEEETDDTEGEEEAESEEETETQY
jgi:hypothetical protein